LASARRPITFEVQGDIPDASSAVELSEGRALRVKNGSYMSIKRFLESHYAVLKDTDVKEINGIISVIRRVEKHENISIQGTSLRACHVMFQKGYRMHPRDLATLAGQGILKVVVARPPKVALFSVGDDLISPKKPYKIGCKYDGGPYGLVAMIKEAGGLADFRGIESCQITPLVRKLAQAIEDKEVDMILMSGGTVAEEENVTADAISGAGIIGMVDPKEIIETMRQAIIVADKTSPNVLGVVGKKPIISVAWQREQAIRGFQSFVRPVISYLLGAK
jgi:molybdopterin molybdotransferase